VARLYVLARIVLMVSLPILSRLDAKRPGWVSQLCRRVLRDSLIVGATAAICMSFAARLIIVPVFGEKFAAAELPGQILMCATLVMAANQLMAVVRLVFNLRRFDLLAVTAGCHVLPIPCTSVCLSLMGLAGFSTSTRAFTTEVTIDANALGRPVNRLILGNNVQWVDRGDEILTPNGRSFATHMLKAIKDLGPSILRYPGGSHSDLYHWKDGIGQRGLGAHFFSGRTQPILFGTDEFLNLCEYVHAEPLLTINIATGDATEAADWVDYVNKGPARTADGHVWPRVQYWEIGNEPYLREDNRKDIAVGPEEFVKRANEFIPAMKRVDPDIKVGVPLRSDILGGIPATPYPGFNEAVLTGLKTSFDFVALHNAYAPFAFDRSYSDRDLYLATVAASMQTAADIESTRAVLRRYLGGRTVPFAITEFAPLFTIGKSSDGYIGTITGALYVADLLRLFALSDDVTLAAYWSLSGNWEFGALSQAGERRPSYLVLRAYSRLLRGNLLATTVDGPSFSSPRVGLMAAQSDVPTIAALAMREGNAINIILINKNPDERAEITVSLKSAGQMGHVSLQELSADGLFTQSKSGTSFDWMQSEVVVDDGQIQASLLPHSVSTLVVEFH
jgi:alpha-L-arabinofuranosidase